MSTKTKENLTVVSQEEIGKDIFSLWLQTDQMAQYARPGQFLSLYTGNAGKLLPRPISICEIDKETSRIRLVYRVTGKNTGTEAFSKMQPGDKIEALGPLGNGFPLEEAGQKSLSDRRRYRYSANAGDCKTVKCAENSCSRLQR